DKCASIITEKDLGIFLLTDESERNLNQIPISEIMKPLQSVYSSLSVKDCAKTMIENSIGSLAINIDNKINGIVTKTDLARYFVENVSGKKIVGEYATLYYAWAYSDTPLHKVVQKMLDEKISRIILKSHNDLPEGILTFRDLFRIALEEGNVTEIADNTDPVISVIFTRKGFLSDTGFGATTTAKQIMSDKIISVRYDDSLISACNLLLDNKINAVGVLSSKGRLIGILSKTDVVRAVSFMN
ncbi:MAG TPA: CBS domain-containing protein, partial [Nitrosopumilaceae archaeon]|nr:CBS domain-containing protein [Nitrosopumilaceae archaeon]